LRVFIHLWQSAGPCDLSGFLLRRKREGTTGAERTDMGHGYGGDARFLIHDRDTKFTALSTDFWTRCLPIPPRAPRANAFVESYIGTCNAQGQPRTAMLFRSLNSAIATAWARGGAKRNPRKKTPSSAPRRGAGRLHHGCGDRSSPHLSAFSRLSSTHRGGKDGVTGSGGSASLHPRLAYKPAKQLKGGPFGAR